MHYFGVALLRFVVKFLDSRRRGGCFDPCLCFICLLLTARPQSALVSHKHFPRSCTCTVGKKDKACNFLLTFTFAVSHSYNRFQCVHTPHSSSVAAFRLPMTLFNEIGVASAVASTGSPELTGTSADGAELDRLTIVPHLWYIGASFHRPSFWSTL